MSASANVRRWGHAGVYLKWPQTSSGVHGRIPRPRNVLEMLLHIRVFLIIQFTYAYIKI